MLALLIGAVGCDWMKPPPPKPAPPKSVKHEARPEVVAPPKIDGAGVVGEGTARGIANASLARQTASNRARADLANKLRARGALGESAPLRGAVITSVERDPRSGVTTARAQLQD